MSQLYPLSTEQQFSFASFKLQAQQLSREQAIELLCIMFEKDLKKDNMYKELLKQQWFGGN